MGELTPLTIKIIIICATILVFVVIFLIGAKHRWLKTASLGLGKASMSLTAQERKENEILTGIQDKLTAVEDVLVFEKKERENFNFQTAERLEIISNTLQEVQEELNEIVLKSLKAIIHSTTAEPIERMQAFKKYLSLGGNGNTVNFAIMDFLLDNKKLWYSLFDRAEDMSKIKCPEHYLYSIDCIKKRVFL